MADAPVEPVGEPWKYNADYQRTAEFLGVNKYDREDFALANKISIISDYASLEGGKDLNGALNKIHDLRHKLGVQAQGKILVDELYRHIRLDMDTKRIKREQAEKKAKLEHAKKLSMARLNADKLNEQQIASVFKKTLVDKDLIKGTVQAVVQKRVEETVTKAMDSILK